MTTRLFQTILLLFISAMGAFAQNEPTEYKTSLESYGYQCTAKKVSIWNGSHTYAITPILFGSNDESYFGLTMQFTTIGDREIVAIARLHNNGNLEEPYETTARIVFDDGSFIYPHVTTVTDVTADDKANSTSIGSAYVGFIFDRSVAPIIRNKNMREITINGHTINLQAIQFNSAPVVDRMFREILKAGYRLDSSGSATLASPVLSSGKSKSAVELIYYPMGILNKDGAGLNYSKALNEVKAKTSWKIDEYPAQDFFITYNMYGYDITWHDLPIFSAQMNTDQYFKWHYSIHFPRNQYTRSQAKTLALAFVKELTDAGFTAESYYFDDTQERPVSKVLKKDTYRVEITLLDKADYEEYSFSIYSYPRW